MAMTEPVREPTSSPARASAPAVRKKITLPNATVGRDYRTHIGFSMEPTVVVVDPSAKGIEGTGLRFDSSTCTVLGSPDKAGDFPFSFKATLEIDPLGPTRTVELEGVLTVNPDP